MNIYTVLIILAVTVCVFAAIHKIGKIKKPVKRAFISVGTGLLTLVIVNIAGNFTGVFVPYSIMSVLTSAIGGIPGVTLLMALYTFF